MESIRVKFHIVLMVVLVLLFVHLFTRWSLSIRSGLVSTYNVLKLNPKLMKSFSTLNAWIYRHEPRCLVKIDNITPRNYFKIFYLFIFVYFWDRSQFSAQVGFILLFYPSKWLRRQLSSTTWRLEKLLFLKILWSCTRVSVSSIHRRGKYK